MTSSTRRHQSDSEYINVNASPSEGDDYVNMAQKSAVESYVNIKPMLHSSAKSRHELEAAKKVTNREPFSPKAQTTTSFSGDNSKFSHIVLHNYNKSLDSDHVASEREGEDEVFDDKHLPANKQIGYVEAIPKYLPSPNAKGDHKRPLPSEYIKLSMVTIGQCSVDHDLSKGYVVKTPSPTVDDPLSSSPSEYVEMLPAASPVKHPQTRPAKVYENHVSIKKSPPTATAGDQHSVDHPEADAPDWYENFVPIKMPSSTSNVPLPSDYEEMVPNSQPLSQNLETKPAKRYEPFSKSGNAEGLDSCSLNEEYSQLQFRNKEANPIIPEQEGSAYSTLSPSSRASSVYSNMDVSPEASKTGCYDNVSVKEKPSVPSRNLKKPIKLNESSAGFTKTPPLPPRNCSISAADPASPTPPQVGPKPVTPPNRPPIGPKPVAATGSSQSPSEMHYCKLDFTELKFRPHTKVIDQVMLPSQNTSYAVVDRDASVGLQLALEQNRRQS